MKSYIGVVGLIIAVLDFSHAVTNFGACETPNREIATCIYLKECTYLYELLEKGSMTQAERYYLQRSQCGYRNQEVLICCPENFIGRPKPLTATTTPRPVNRQGTGSTSGSLLPSSPQCGQVFEDKIYGGNVTAREEYPWLALIAYTKPGNTIGHHCGGSLINERYVITAAHCVNTIPSDWRLTGVRLGEWDTQTNPDCIQQRNNRLDCAPPHLDVPVESIHVHPQYSARSRDQYHDVALLRLSYPVSYNSTISPVCLPLNAEQRSNLYVGAPMDVSGWGRTETSSTSDKKLKATVTVQNINDCQRKYTSQRITLTQNQLCAGGVEGIDSCRGDSGGPLVVLERFNGQSSYYLAGVVSFGPTPCGLQGWAGVYTRIGAYIDWITSVVKA